MRAEEKERTYLFTQQIRKLCRPILVHPHRPFRSLLLGLLRLANFGLFLAVGDLDELKRAIFFFVLFLKTISTPNENERSLANGRKGIGAGRRTPGLL
jgi:hypothetical protein